MEISKPHMPSMRWRHSPTVTGLGPHTARTGAPYSGNRFVVFASCGKHSNTTTSDALLERSWRLDQELKF